MYFFAGKPARSVRLCGRAGKARRRQAGVTAGQHRGGNPLSLQVEQNKSPFVCLFPCTVRRLVIRRQHWHAGSWCEPVARIAPACIRHTACPRHKSSRPVSGHISIMTHLASLSNKECRNGCCASPNNDKRCTRLDFLPPSQMFVTIVLNSSKEEQYITTMYSCPCLQFPSEKKASVVFYDTITNRTGLFPHGTRSYILKCIRSYMQRPSTSLHVSKRGRAVRVAHWGDGRHSKRGSVSTCARDQAQRGGSSSASGRRAGAVWVRPRRLRDG